MPTTTNWELEYESPSSLPGVTITGGPAMASPILAVQVDSALTTLSARIDGIDSDIAAIQSDITDMQTDIAAGAADITNLTNWTRRGTANLTFTTQESFTASVSFGFTFPAAPTVTTNLRDSSAASARWDSRAITITTTGFTVFVYSNAAGSTSTWSAIPIGWVANYR